MNVSRRTLKPFMPPSPTKAGRWLWGGTLGVVAVCVLAAGATGRASEGTVGGFDPSPTFMILAFAGSAAFLVITVGWRLPVVTRLYPQPSPLAVISHESLELQIPSLGIRCYRWDEIGSLSPSKAGHGSLCSPAGEELVDLPPCLMAGARRTLAQLIVEVQGDRFRLERSRPFQAPKYFTTCDRVAVL